MRVVVAGCLLVVLWAGQARGEMSARVREALWLGMDYMIGSASVRENFEEFASDYLFFFADVARIPDPWIQAMASRHGRRLGRVYLDELFATGSADEVVDAASALWALDQLGMDVEAERTLLRQAAGDYPLCDYWYFRPWIEAPDLDELIDLLIGFHFTDRFGIDVGPSYAEALLFVPSVPYVPDAEIGGDRYVDQNNLVTHLVYTLSGYATWYLPPELVPRELAYIRAQIVPAAMWADTETLAEYVDSLKVMGFDENDPDVRHGVEVLLAIQKPDGRWEPDEVEDEYDRYHATWCAMDALRSYDLAEGAEPPHPAVLSLLRRWARQWRQGLPMQPRMDVEPTDYEGQ